MAWCLTAPSYYLDQCWLLISEFLWHSPQSNFTVSVEDAILYNEFENYVFKMTATSHRGQWVKVTSVFSLFYYCTIYIYMCIYIAILCHIRLQFYWTKPGACFTNLFLPAIQIRWKLRLAIIPLLAIRSQQIFAHATTALLSCHVQNLVAITVLETRWEWKEIFIKFELRWKNSETVKQGPD